MKTSNDVEPDLANAILMEFINTFLKQRELGDKTLAQLSEQDIHITMEEDSNTISTIVKHLNGNMHSRWTDFLTTDGEKSTRNRDEEFELTEYTKAEIIALWEDEWAVVLETLQSLQASDLNKTIYIRKEEHTVYQAILRQISHYAYHVGQIVYLAKLIKKNDWKLLSIPKNQSAKYNTEAGEFKYNN